MRDCTTCPNKDYCIPDECLGTKKSTQKHGNAKGRIEKYPFKVYHIVKPKGNKTMIELKITVDKAVELEQEVKDLYQSIVGAPIKKDPITVELVKKETPKVEVTRDEPVEEKIEAPVKVEVPSLEATRAAVKDYIDKAADKTQAKTDFKSLLDEIGAEKVTSATAEQRIQIMEWVNSRG